MLLWLVLVGESISSPKLKKVIKDENSLYEGVLSNQIRVIKMILLYSIRHFNYEKDIFITYHSFF